MLQLLFCIIFIILIIYILFFSKEKYRYTNMYQAYEVPFIDMQFIASGTRPALGDYLRTSDFDQSPILVQYENEKINNDSCNICLVNCLNPVSLLYKNKKDALQKCVTYCQDECKHSDVQDMINEVKLESKDQMAQNRFD